MPHPTMFETIMDLPLFKGVGPAHVQDFVGSTHLDFRKYAPGDTIVNPADECTRLTFLLSGTAKVTYASTDGSFRLSYRCGRGAVLGADKLFGMVHKYMCEASASNTVGVMEMTKEQYISLIKSDNIYLLNLLNYLSYASQRATLAMQLPLDRDLRQIIATRLMMQTTPLSYDIEIDADFPTLGRMTNLSEGEIAAQIRGLSDEGLIGSASDGKIRILDRAAFIEPVIT